MNDFVHDRVIATLKTLGQYRAQFELRRSLALDQGRLVAEKFRYPGGYAVWTVEPGELTFYDEDGRFLKSISVPPGGKRRAA